jgi:two-component system OmpR family sensor kinase
MNDAPEPSGRVSSPATPAPVGVHRLVPRSFRGKIVLSTVALMTVAMLLIGLGIQLLLARTAQRDINTVLDDRADALVTVVQQASTEQLTVPPEALEPGTEVFDGNGDLVAGSVERDVREAAHDLANTDTRRTMNGPHERERLIGVPFTTPSGDRGVIVVSQETGPYERSEFYAFLATVAVGVLVVAFTALMALRVTRQALEPVAQMARRAVEWSEHDLTHRFALGPPTNELASLGQTLDQLLDRVADAIRTEQRLTAELAHELRTPLTNIQGSAGLALMRGVKDAEDREDFEEIAVASREMSAVIKTLLDIARDNTGGEHGTTCTVAEVMTVVGGPTEGRILVDDRTDGSNARIAAPRDLVARALAPLVDNAIRHARHRITFTASDHPDHVELVIADDGAGVAENVRQDVFEPGATQGSGGAGLGLGIARRIARSFGGDITLGHSTPSTPSTPSAEGATFVLTMPRR